MGNHDTCHVRVLFKSGIDLIRQLKQLGGLDTAIHKEQLLRFRPDELLRLGDPLQILVDVNALARFVLNECQPRRSPQ